MSSLFNDAERRQHLDELTAALKKARLLPQAFRPHMVIGSYPGPLRPQDLPPGSVAIPDLAFQIAECVSESQEQSIISLLSGAIQSLLGGAPEVIGGCINDQERWGAWAQPAVDASVEAARQQAVQQLNIAEGAIFGIFVSQNLLNAAAQAVFQNSQQSAPAGTTLKSISIALEAPDKTITYIRGNEQLTLPSADFTVTVVDTLSTAGGQLVSTPKARFDGDLWALIALSFLGLAGNPYWAGELASLFFEGAPDGSPGIGDELVQYLPTKILTATGKQLFQYSDVFVTNNVGITASGLISAEMPRDPKIAITGPLWIGTTGGRLKPPVGRFTAVPNDEFTPDTFAWTVDGAPLSSTTNPVNITFNVPTGSPVGSVFTHTLAVTATDSVLGISNSSVVQLTVNVIDYEPPIPPGRGPQHPPPMPPRWP